MAKKTTATDEQLDDHIKTEVLHEYGQINEEVAALSAQIQQLSAEARHALMLASTNRSRFGVHYNNDTLDRLQAAREELSAGMIALKALALTLTQDFKAYNSVPIQANPKAE